MLNLVQRVRNSIRRTNFDRLTENALAALPGTYVPWSHFSMRPGAVVTVLNDIWINERKTIVECGGGMSTIYIGRLLKQMGSGALTTVEHDELWANRLREVVGREELPVTVVHAPIVPGPQGGWYDVAAIPTMEHVELLVVDGPPAHLPETAESRYPALPHFAPVLVDGATVVLDDIVRAGELAVCSRWEREYAVQLDRQFGKGAVAVGTYRRR